MRKNGTLTYILADHLGSTSLLTDSSGAVINQTKYKAWGETRYTSGTEQTKYTYTGQYSYTADFGLMFYNARWYDPYLNHFTQPDSIVPDPTNPQDWDRYAYARNNPLRYTDPTGHVPCWEGSWAGNCLDEVGYIKYDIEDTYSVRLTGGWDKDELNILSDSLAKAAKLAGGVDNLQDVFNDAMNANGHPNGTLTFDNRSGNTKPQECNDAYACWAYWKDTIVLSDYIFTTGYQFIPTRYRPKELGLYKNLNAGIQVTMIHEMMHVFSDARPLATRIYNSHIHDGPAEENMANTLAFYAVSGMPDWSGKPNHFDFVRFINWMWQATP